MKVDFNECVVRDIEGNAVTGDVPVWKNLAQMMFTKATNLDLVEAARVLHQTGACDLTDSMYASLMDMLTNKDCTFFAFAKQAIIAHLEDTKLKAKKEGQ